MGFQMFSGLANGQFSSPQIHLLSPPSLISFLSFRWNTDWMLPRWSFCVTSQTVLWVLCLMYRRSLISRLLDSKKTKVDAWQRMQAKESAQWAIRKSRSQKKRNSQIYAGRFPEKKITSVVLYRWIYSNLYYLEDEYQEKSLKWSSPWKPWLRTKNSEVKPEDNWYTNPTCQITGKIPCNPHIKLNMLYWNLQKTQIWSIPQTRYVRSQGMPQPNL